MYWPAYMLLTYVYYRYHAVHFLLNLAVALAFMVEVALALNLMCCSMQAAVFMSCMIVITLTYISSAYVLHIIL